MSQNNNFEDFLNSDEYDKLVELLQNSSDDEINMVFGSLAIDNIPIISPKSPIIDLPYVVDNSINKEEKSTKHGEENNMYSLDIDKIEITKMQKRNTKNRCGKCNSKLKLINFTCRCGITFCSNHRFPENHLCNYDHKKKSREIMRHDNPVVTANKVPKI